jgi:hypothetical protein
VLTVRSVNLPFVEQPYAPSARLDALASRLNSLFGGSVRSRLDSGSTVSPVRGVLPRTERFNLSVDGGLYLPRSP